NEDFISDLCQAGLQSDLNFRRSGVVGEFP
ncbi:MAG: hypothetical protein ACI8P0_004367, partial [Planctomycetaceae bacterium]